MPFRIIRNDITRVKADAIVNTANPKPTVGPGTDSAIYHAAGKAALLAERKKIGAIAPGEATVTSAFALPAKYIIHTVGPVWQDGEHGEFDILRSCYAKSLALAQSLGCQAIAFPLIATGAYGFPKDKALSIALSEIREFLEKSDMQVTLVVFGRGTFRLANELTERVEEYIDENYEAAARKKEYGTGSIHRRKFTELQRMIRPELEEIEEPEEYEEPLDEMVMAAPSSIEDAVSHLGESFQKRLLRMIDERGMTDAEVYKRANVDRKLFSKIRCSEDYIPKKKTIIALAIALKLNLDDTRDLLGSAGYALTNSSKSDVIICFCIENGNYDIYEVNALLFKFGQSTLG